MTRVRAIAAFLADRGDHDRARADEVRRERRAAPAQVCDCRSCRAFYKRHPLDGWQLLLFPRAEIEGAAPDTERSAGSGSRRSATPLPVSGPRGSSTSAGMPVPVSAPARADAAHRKPETQHA